MKIIARLVALDDRKMPSAVAREEHDGVHDIDRVGILRIGGDAGKIPAAMIEARIARHLRPGGTPIVGAVEPAFLRIDQGIHALRFRLAHRKPDASHLRGQSVTFQLRPAPAAVARFEKPAARPVRGRIDIPGRPARLPQRGIDDIGVAGLEGEIDGAGVGVAEQGLFPRRPAILRAEHAAHRIGRVRMAQRRHQHHIGIARIDEDPADLLRVGET